MSKFLIYRVENVLGDGPYSSPPRDNELSNYLLNHSGCEAHPTPWKSGEPWEHFDTWNAPKDHIFGFLLLEDVYKWFDRKELLQRNKFLLTTIEAPLWKSDEVLMGRSQVSFPRVWRENYLIQRTSRW